MLHDDCWRFHAYDGFLHWFFHLVNRQTNGVNFSFGLRFVIIVNGNTRNICCSQFLSSKNEKHSICFRIRITVPLTCIAHTQTFLTRSLQTSSLFEPFMCSKLELPTSTLKRWINHRAWCFKPSRWEVIKFTCWTVNFEIGRNARAVRWHCYVNLAVLLMRQ